MYTYKNDSIELIKDTFKHLKNGRFKMALTSAQKIYIDLPEDPIVLSFFAWANLENGNPTYALELADLAVMYSQGDLAPKLYRGYFLYRMGIYKGALKDFEIIKTENRELYYWSHLNKARVLAAEGHFEDALLLADKLCSNGKAGENPFRYVKDLIIKCTEFHNPKIIKRNKKIPSYLKDAADAFENKEYWFSLKISNEILQNSCSQDELRKSVIILISSFLNTFQFKLAYNKAEEFKSELKDDPEFQELYQRVPKNFGRTKNSNNILPVKNDRVKKISIGIESARAFNLNAETNSGKRKYLNQFDEKNLTCVGIETIVVNPYYKKSSMNVKGTAVWYLNEVELGRNNFTLYLDSDWEKVEFVQSQGNDYFDYWTTGIGRVEIYLNDELKVNKNFDIAYDEIGDEEPKKKFQQAFTKYSYTTGTDKSGIKVIPGDEADLETLLNQLNDFVGLDSVKKTMRNYVDYLQFINERKKLGLHTNDNLSINCIFLGNPGTGKTTIARLIGKIFKSMGLLKNGHTIEVDRASLVGQYIGETAQKTEQVIKDAMGGLLFIDEAYSLSKSGNKQDFGQEAVDILLKRLEDHSGEFAVIAAGYPEEMQTFINSNPGLKSRFHYQFNFEDYTPEELIKIFNQFVEKEEYKLDEGALFRLHKEFTSLYRKRDKNFGNARLVKNYFNEIKLQVGKRSLMFSKNEMTKENLSKIIEEDIREVFENDTVKKVNIKIDEEKLSRALDELNNLTGLEPVKKEINELVKLARYFNQQEENLQDKFSFHFVFSGNPGTGKTTVARLFSRIYSALGILPKGHLVEADRQVLVGNYVGETAIKTSKIIDEAIGGTLFIDEAYSLVKQGELKNSDFGSESINTLIKRMEDNRGKFITIAAGYTEQMKLFLDSNPGIKSRFTHVIEFEDYTPKQLLEITEVKLALKNYKLGNEVKLLLEQHYKELYTQRDSSFGNARLTRNLAEKMIKNHLLRMSELPVSERTKDTTTTINIEDIKNITAAKKKFAVELRNENIDKYLNELDNLTGIQGVKDSIKKLVKSLRVARIKEEQGVSAVYKNLNSVFMGNPGNGKRTVAGSIGSILREMGILAKGHVIEAGKTELLSDYPWEAKSKIISIIQKSFGGILFLNDIGSMSNNSFDFIHDLTGLLIKEMEEKKNQFVIIAAGKQDETIHFLNNYPLFKAQFNNYFYFEDFSPRQMLDIALSLTEKNGYKLDEGAWQLLLDRFAGNAYNIQNGLMNAHYIETIINKSISNQEERFAAVSNIRNEDLSTITFDDIKKINLNEL